MVVGTGSDTCGQDWRHTLAIGPAGRAGNSKSLPCSPGLLANLIVRQLWSVRATQPYVRAHPDFMRSSYSRRCRNDPRVGKGVRRTDPYFAAADAPSRRCYETIGVRRALMSFSTRSSNATPLPHPPIVHQYAERVDAGNLHVRVCR